MKRKAPLASSILVFALLVFSAPIFAEEAPWYIGSEKCRDCHMDQFNVWQASGHPYKLRKAEKVRYAGIPLPKGYKWEDISYVIGGANKKARFIDNKGYIITKAKDGSPAPTQYNMISGKWVNYKAGKKAPYKCGPCHMTAYKKEGHQDGLPGIIGTWAEGGVGCEECHGPGSAHAYAEEPTKETVKIDTDAQACGKCHQRSGQDIPPLASKGFIKHHEQINEINTGAHEGTDCIECHNPHERVSNVRTQCTDCHEDKPFQEYAKNTTHGKSGVTCVDCHMPHASKSAIKTGKFRGDVRSHLIKINLDPKAKMFIEGEFKGVKGTFAQGYVTSDFSCLACHGARDRTWAAENGKNYHGVE